MVYRRVEDVGENVISVIIPMALLGLVIGGVMPAICADVPRHRVRAHARREGALGLVTHREGRGGDRRCALPREAGASRRASGSAPARHRLACRDAHLGAPRVLTSTAFKLVAPARDFLRRPDARRGPRRARSPRPCSGARGHRRHATLDARRRRAGNVVNAAALAYASSSAVASARRGWASRARATTTAATEGAPASRSSPGVPRRAAVYAKTYRPVARSARRGAPAGAAARRAHWAPVPVGAEVPAFTAGTAVLAAPGADEIAAHQVSFRDGSGAFLPGSPCRRRRRCQGGAALGEGEFRRGRPREVRRARSRSPFMAGCGGVCSAAAPSRAPSPTILTWWRIAPAPACRVAGVSRPPRRGEHRPPRNPLRRGDVRAPSGCFGVAIGGGEHTRAAGCSADGGPCRRGWRFRRETACLRGLRSGWRAESAWRPFQRARLDAAGDVRRVAAGAVIRRRRGGACARSDPHRDCARRPDRGHPSPLATPGDEFTAFGSTLAHLHLQGVWEDPAEPPERAQRRKIRHYLDATRGAPAPVACPDVAASGCWARSSAAVAE